MAVLTKAVGAAAAAMCAVALLSGPAATAQATPAQDAAAQQPAAQPTTAQQPAVPDAAPVIQPQPAPVRKPRARAPQRARHETNASREARLARTIAETYSHRYEIFGGGGFMRFRSGDTLRKNNEVSWNMTGARYFNPRVAVIASAQGSFGNAKATINNQYGVYSPQINEYFFQGGGQYRFVMHEKLAVSAQAQAGVGWGIFSGDSKGLPSTLLGIYPDGFKPSFELGVNVDYHFFPNLSFRVTPNYQASTFGGGVQNNLGFNAGFVYSFGKQ